MWDEPVGTLIIDANAIRARHNNTISQIAAAFNSRGYQIVMLECIKPGTGLSRRGKFARMGYPFDDLIHLESPHYELYDTLVMEKVKQIVEETSGDIFVVTGSGMVFQKVNSMGIGVVLHG